MQVEPVIRDNEIQSGEKNQHNNIIKETLAFPSNVK